MIKKPETEEEEVVVTSRRAVLRRIGLVATAAYSVPAFTTLSTAAADGAKRSKPKAQSQK